MPFEQPLVKGFFGSLAGKAQEGEVGLVSK